MLPLIILGHLLILSKTQFTLWPEMVVYPYLMTNGFTLYRDIINPYTPLFNFALAAFGTVFGYQVLPYQILTYLQVVLIDLLIYYATFKIFKNKQNAILSTLFFTFLSVPFGINGLWYDLVQTPLVLLSLVNFLSFIKNPNSKKSAILLVFFLTTAFFIKQQILWLVIFFFISAWVIFKEKIKDIIVKNFKLLFVPALFLIIFSSVFYYQNALSEFFFLAFYFPFIKASQMPGYVLFPTFRQLVIVLSLFVVFIPVLFKKSQDTKIIFLTGSVLALFAFPRFDYFHLIPALAVLSLLVPQNFSKISLKFNTSFFLFIPLIILIFTFARYVKNNSSKEVRFFEKDIISAANFIDSANPTGEIIFIQNGPDQLLPLSKTLPPKPWAIQFPWYLELERIESRVRSGLMSENPKFIVAKPYEIRPKYQIGAYRPEKIASYIDQNYTNFVQISDTLWLKIKK